MIWFLSAVSAIEAFFIWCAFMRIVELERVVDEEGAQDE